MGFVVMDEAFDCWEHGKREHDYGTLFKQWHERDLEALILRDRNHPCVIMWSTGNEVHEQYYPETGMTRHLTEVVHRYDTTRPATFGASYPSKSAMNGTELQVDDHGMNYAAGVYGDPTSHIVFSSPSRPAFNGLLLAIVRPTRGYKGKLEFMAQADGLRSACLKIRAKGR